jgi:3-hydroxyisobutyrate dehydrogenase-like beta-hydroxyacid dehydrogenase
VLTQSLFEGEVRKAYGGKSVDERHTPDTTVPLAIKDLRLALAEAEATCSPTPMAFVVHDRLLAMMARNWSDLDCRPWACLPLSRQGSRCAQRSRGRYE